MQDKSSYSNNSKPQISEGLQNFINAMVEEIVLKGEAFDVQKKKWLKKYSEAEGLNYAELEGNLKDFFEAIHEYQMTRNTTIFKFIKKLAKLCYIQEDIYIDLSSNYSTVNKENKESFSFYLAILLNIRNVHVNLLYPYDYSQDGYKMLIKDLILKLKARAFINGNMGLSIITYGNTSNILIKNNLLNNVNDNVIDNIFKPTAIFYNENSLIDSLTLTHNIINTLPSLHWGDVLILTDEDIMNKSLFLDFATKVKYLSEKGVEVTASSPQKNLHNMEKIINTREFNPYSICDWIDRTRIPLSLKK
jgi:hypothetical protein